ncbi:hypothetical protein TWF281_010720 [Arthrobotrys megalospora]
MTETVIYTSEAPSEAYGILEDHQFSDETTCAVCGALTSFTCPTCHGVAYCSAAHALQDLPYHGLICSAAASIPPRPSGGLWAAVLVLPEHSKQPYYAWTEYKLNRHNLPVFEQSRWYGDGYKTRPTFILRHPITRQTLAHAIMNFELIHPKPGVESSKPKSYTNLCVHNLTGGVNSAAFRGTLLMVTLARTMDKSKTWMLSFKPQDIHILVEELKNPDIQMTKTTKSDSIRGVACFPSSKPTLPNFNGDNTSDFNNGTEGITLESLNIPTNHPIFTSATDDSQIYEPPLGKLYNFPIRMFVFLNYHGPQNNTFVQTFFPAISITPNPQPRPTVGKSNFTPSSLKTAAVLFARSDGKPLEIRHLQEFSRFVEEVTSTWSAYDAYMKVEEEIAGKFEQGRNDKMLYRKIEDKELELVVKMDKTLEKNAFWEFWMERNGGGDEGPFKGVDMEEDSDESDDDEMGDFDI